MSRLTKIFLATFIALLSLVAVSPRIYAFDAFKDTCNGAADSSVCQDNASGKGANLASSSDGIISKIANIIAAVAGIVAVVFIMVNGFTFMTSTGDSAKLSKAREGLIYAAIGLVIVVLSRTIIALILRYL